MRRSHPKFSALLFIFLLAGTSAACGGGGGGDGTDNSDPAAGSSADETASSGNEPSAQLAKSEAVSAVTGLLFVAGDSAGSADAGTDAGADAPRGSDRGLDRLGRQISQTVSCPEGGSAVLSGDFQLDRSATPRTFSFDASATLNGCNGNSGSAAIQIDGTAQRGLVEFTADVTGTVSGTCTVDIPSVSEQANIVATSNDPSRDEQDINVSGTLTGSASANCDGQAVRCVWNNVDISDRAALEAGCVAAPR